MKTDALGAHYLNQVAADAFASGKILGSDKLQTTESVGFGLLYGLAIIRLERRRLDLIISIAGCSFRQARACIEATLALHRSKSRERNQLYLLLQAVA